MGAAGRTGENILRNILLERKKKQVLLRKVVVNMFADTLQHMFTSKSQHRAVEFFDAKLEFLIDPVALKDMLNSPDINIIDVRDEQSYREGHLPGAINLPKDRWSSFSGLSRSGTNVIYCYSLTCQLSARACKEFAENDYEVKELIGGFEEWKKKDFPVER